MPKRRCSSKSCRQMEQAECICGARQAGVADTLKSKSRLTATGEEVGESVARGGELYAAVSEILPAGAELLGMFPADVRATSS
jgi:hypothetical protein